MEALRRLLESSEAFMPHGHCYLWKPGLVWLHVLSDSVIALAYLSIPFTLAYFARRRRDLPFRWLFLAFGLFIVACGATHALEVWNVWRAEYWLAGGVKAFTAAVSLATAVLLVRAVPEALTLRTDAELRGMHAELRRAFDEERATLARRTAERDAAAAKAAAERRSRSEAEERFRLLFESATEAIVCSDASGRIVLFNPAAERVFGYSALEALGRELSLIAAPEQAEKHRDGFARLFAAAERPVSGRTLELAGRRKDGELVPIELSLSFSEEGEGGLLVTGFIRDVSERRRAEAALRKAEEEYRGLFENAVVGIYRSTLDGRCAIANPTLARLYGYETPEALIDSNLGALYVRPGRRDDFVRELRERGSVEGFESQVYRKDGSVIWVSENARAVRGDGGEIASYEGTLVDITSLKAAEADRNRLVAIVETTPDIVAVTGTDGSAIYLNRAARKLLGVGPDEDVAQVNTGAVRRLIPEAASATAVRDGVWTGVVDLVDATGREVPVSQVVLAHRSTGSAVDFLSTIARDLSEQRAVEEQLRQSQKLEAVGRLAGGVAHDFNNILGVIIGYGEMLRRGLRQSDPMLRRVEEILKAAQRAAGLTRQLLAFSRKQVLEPRLLDPSALLGDVEEMLDRVIGEDVDIVLETKANGWVKADAGQLEQVILNLAVNARDAMPRGGSLRIETADVDLVEEYVQRRDVVKPGRYVVFSVSDTGCGMDEATQARIFEPFFTTKPEGKGTGLGLAMVYGIVKQSGGYVWVYSEVGRGTTFRFYLPRVDPPAEPVRERPADGATRGGTETVLVVEDEPAARALIVEVLRDEGYSVIEAGDGAEALAGAERLSGALDLVLTDVVLPKLGGRVVAERLQAARPRLKVLYMSGYTEEALSHQGVIDPGVNLLRKPFTPSELRRRVREMLDSPP